jgi:hypothetical protein
VKVTLNTNSHKDYFVEGKQVQAEVELNEEREVNIGHVH